MADMQCAKCGGVVEAEIAPPGVTNLEHVTIILIEHSGYTTCGACGQSLVPTVQGIGNLAVCLAPVKPRPPKNLVVPANGIIRPS